MAATRTGSDLTRVHRAAQAAIAADVARLVRQAWPLLDPRDLAATADQWMRAVLPIILDGRRRSQNAAVAYLRAFTQVERGSVPRIVIPDTAQATRQAAETSLRVTGPITIETLTTAGYDLGHSTGTALTGVLGASGRHALDAGRQVVQDTVAADPASSGWRRVGDGACKFCQMLIGRNEVYSADTARFASHDHCNCSAEPAYGPDKRASVEQYTASKRNITDADRARVRTFLRGMD